MADIPPPPINTPVQDAQGKLTPEWVRWFKTLEKIIKGLA
jgi:hypothetical protein